MLGASRRKEALGGSVVWSVQSLERLNLGGKGDRIERIADQRLWAASFCAGYGVVPSSIGSIMIGSTSKECVMGQSGNTKAEHDGIEGPRGPSPRAPDWLWCPWYAKSYWILAGIYWAGLYGLLVVPTDQQNYYVANAMILLIFVFNPITVLAVLGYGFLKAKIACGDWIAGSCEPLEHAEWLRREREAAYLNPVDVRSGYLHQQYMDRSRHPTGHAGL